MGPRGPKFQGLGALGPHQGGAAFSLLNVGNVDIGAQVALKADASSVNGAVAGLQNNINALYAGGPLTELEVANPTYATVGDNIVDAYLHAKVDANNTAGFRLRNTNHSAGSSTLSLDAWDSSLSVQQSAPVNALALNYNADTGKKLLSTDTIAVGTTPASYSVGGVYCQTLNATSGASVTGTVFATDVSVTNSIGCGTINAATVNQSSPAVGTVLKSTWYNLHGNLTQVNFPNTTTTYTTVGSVNYTPVSNSSQLFITFVCQINAATGTTANWNIRVLVDSTAVGGVICGHMERQDNSPCIGVYANSSTTQKTISIDCKNGGTGGSSLFFLYDGAYGFKNTIGLRVEEIAS